MRRSAVSGIRIEFVFGLALIALVIGGWFWAILVFVALALDARWR